MHQLARAALPAATLVLALAAFVPTAAAQSTSADLGAFELLGGGTVGARGLPRLVFDGAPLVSRPFAMRLERAASGSLGYLGLGVLDSPTPLPAFGAVVHPAPLFQLVPFATDALGRTDELVSSAALPPYLVGVELVAQAFVFDAAAQGGLAFSGGRRVAIGADEPKKRFRDEAFPTSRWPESIDLADLDGDGWSDAVVGNMYAEGFDVLFGLPGARFVSSASPYPPQGEHTRRRLADIDLDGDVDVVSTENSRLNVHRANGDGTFADPVFDYYAYDYPGDYELADVNGDGFVDVLAVGDEGESFLRVALNDGTGAFLDYVEHATGPWPTRVAVADLDGDGDVDATTWNQSDQTHTVLVNDGNGVFTIATSFPFAIAKPHVVELIDVDMDGLADLVTIASNPHFVGVRVNAGNGTFGPMFQVPLPELSWCVKAADLDHDGDRDLVVGVNPVESLTAPHLNGRAIVLIGAGDGSFVEGASYRVLGDDPYFELADIDADGWIDLVYGTDWGTFLGVLRGTGPGTFEDSEHVAAPDRPRLVTTADVDLDGYDDALIASANTPEVWIHFGSPDGLVPTQPATVLPIEVYHDLTSSGQSVESMLGRRMVAEDVTGDGRPDLVVTDADSVDVYAGDGSGGFALVREVDLPGQPLTIAVADMDGDGLVDLVTHEEATGSLHVALGTSPGSWSPTTVTSPFAHEIRDLLCADFDQDGLLDVAAATDGTSLHIALGIGGGAFAAAFPSTTASSGRSIACGDLDHDGFLDLAVLNQSSSEVSVVRGTGNGTFVDEQRVPLGLACYAVHLTDLDLDGNTDLIVVLSGSAIAHLGRGDGSFGELRGFATGIGSYDVARGDIDGDGLEEWLTLSSWDRQLIALDDLLFE